jgi:hypothetical protein
MAVWQFRPLNPNENSGSSTVDDNFADEQRSSADILVRETIQNPLDARSEGQSVRVRYYITSVAIDGSTVIPAIFQRTWLEHAIAGGLRVDHTVPRRISFLVIEDFGTSGLEGSYNDSSVDGETENWNAFWFREGEGAKRSRSNGGAGQGKITLYLASLVRTVFAITSRRSDAMQLAFGCTRFRRNYKIEADANRWSKEARWGATDSPNKLATPIEDMDVIEAMKVELQLDRGVEPGTSFVIPLPNEAITEDSIKEAVINEFFFAISRGHLSVDVGHAHLDSSTIETEAEHLGDRCRLTKHYRAFLRSASTLVSQPPTATAKMGWNTPTKLDPSGFPEGTADASRAAFEAGSPVVFEMPVVVRESGKEPVNTTFRVVLQQSTDDATQELFVRQDLAVDSEKRLASFRSASPVMALTYIDHPSLSDLLVCAEEPTHRSWNAKRPKVLNKYVAPDRALHAVRNAALRILIMISPDGKRDETALSLFFADPNADLTDKRGGSGSQPDRTKPNSETPGDIPPARPKPLLVTASGRGFIVASNPAKDRTFLPLQCSIEVAYATSGGDSYKQWDSADFWLADDKMFKAGGNHIGALVRGGNTLEFQLLAPEAKFAITGFDAERQLDIRVKYKEVPNASDI